MAKGNMFLGYARGKIGSLVFSRRKGEQITRARNFAPANPRTNAQLTQRMKMYAPVKLYRQSMARFFKYAFSLKEKETIFNGFMRENIALAPWVSRELAAEQAPIPFPARMSSGGVGAVVTELTEVFDDDTRVGRFYGGENADGYNALGYAIDTEAVPSALTIGEFSASVLAQYPSLQAGDQLTFVMLVSDALSVEDNKVLYNGTGAFAFTYSKLVLDPSSSATLASAGISVMEGNGERLFVGIEAKGTPSIAAKGFCVIVTRNVGGKVDASNTSLLLNDDATQIYNLMRTDAYRLYAAQSYRVSPDAYLNPATTTNS